MATLKFSLQLSVGPHVAALRILKAERDGTVIAPPYYSYGRIQDRISLTYGVEVLWICDAWNTSGMQRGSQDTCTIACKTERAARRGEHRCQKQTFLSRTADSTQNRFSQQVTGTAVQDVPLPRCEAGSSGGFGTATTPAEEISKKLSRVARRRQAEL